MHGHQRRRTGRVDRDRGPFQAERVRHPAGHHAADVPRGDVAFDIARRIAGERQIVLGGHSGEDAGVAAAERVSVESGAFEGLPCGFEEQPLLGIHGERFARADAEERRVERGCVVEKATLADITRTRVVGVGVEERVEIPVPVGGHLRNGVVVCDDQVPQFLRIARATGIAARHSDDRDGLVERGRGGRVGGDSRLLPRDVGTQMGREGVRCGVVEDEGGREVDAREGGELVTEFDGGEGVEPQLLERLGGGNRIGPGVAQDRGRQRLDLVEQ